MADALPVPDRLTEAQAADSEGEGCLTRVVGETHRQRTHGHRLGCPHPAYLCGHARQGGSVTALAVVPDPEDQASPDTPHRLVISQTELNT